MYIGSCHALIRNALFYCVVAQFFILKTPISAFYWSHDASIANDSMDQRYTAAGIDSLTIQYHGNPEIFPPEDVETVPRNMQPTTRPRLFFFLFFQFQIISVKVNFT